VILKSAPDDAAAAHSKIAEAIVLIARYVEKHQMSRISGAATAAAAAADASAAVAAE
jgi:hypothetical protein